MKCEFNLHIHDEVLIEPPSKNGVFRNPLGFFSSDKIPDLTPLPEILDEPVFYGYRKGGCRSGGDNVNQRGPDGHLLLVCPSLREWQTPPRTLCKTMISPEPIFPKESDILVRTICAARVQQFFLLQKIR